MAILFILERKLLDRGGSVWEDHALDRQERVLVVIMVPSVCISRVFKKLKCS